MSRYLNLGNAGFQSIRRGLYVDKTGLIEYVNRTLGTKDKTDLRKQAKAVWKIICDTDAVCVLRQKL